MRKGVCALSLAGLLAASGTASAATYLIIDGKLAGEISSFDGGDARAAVVSTPLPDGTVDKHIGAVSYAPLAIRMPLQLGPTFAWIGKLLTAGASTSATLQLVDVNAADGTASATEYAGAVLVEAQFSGVDPKSSGTGDLTLIAQVTQSGSAKAAQRPASGLLVGTGAVRLEISGLDTSGVEHIEPFSIRRTGPKAALEASNLVVTLTDLKSRTWQTWFTDFLINATSKDEKSGSLLFSDATSGVVAAQIDFSGLGIVRFSRVGNGGNQAELYVEKASIKSQSGSGNGSTAIDSKALLSNTNNPGSGIKAAGEGKILAQSGAGASIANADTLSSRAVSGVNTTTAAVTPAAANLNPADAGTKDPTQFPRVSGLTRLSYSGTFQPDYTSEDASYTTTESFGSLVQHVDAAAKAAGWTLGALEEGTSGDGKTAHEAWTKGGASASVDFHEFTGDSTRMNLVVYVTLGQ